MATAAKMVVGGCGKLTCKPAKLFDSAVPVAPIRPLDATGAYSGFERSSANSGDVS